MSTTTSEDQLLLSAQEGDVTAFEELVARHRDGVFGLALRLLNSSEVAMEVTQHAFLLAHGRLSQFFRAAQFGGWVHQSAASQALTRLRQKTPSPRPGPVAPKLDEGPAEARGPWPKPWPQRMEGAGAIDAELRDAIELAASSLPADRREVFVLHDLEGVSYEEIGLMTQSPVSVVKARLHGARLVLRAAIGGSLGRAGAKNRDPSTFDGPSSARS